MTTIPKFKKLGDALVFHSRSKYKGITFIEENEDIFLSYHDLYHDACKVLNSINSTGIKRNAEIIIQLDNNRWFIIVFWACILGGYYPVPVQTAITTELAEKLKNIWNKLDDPYIISQKSLFQKLCTDNLYGIGSRCVFIEELMNTDVMLPSPPHLSNSIAFIQFSSGSCGDPKGIILRHNQILANLYSFLKRAEYTTHDNPISWMPLVHDMGLIGFHIAPLLMGSNHSVLPTSLFIRRPLFWLKKASQYKSTILNATTSSLNYFLKHFKNDGKADLDLSSVRLVFNGAEPVSAKTCSSFISIMKNYGLKENTMYPVYGLAEATLAVTFPHLQDKLNIVTLDRTKLINFKSIKPEIEKSHNSLQYVGLGYPIDGIKLRITNADHKPLPQETIGLIQIKGPSITEGYYNEPDKTKKSINEDGWLNTGDLGFLKKNCLYITGRYKDVIFKNGQNIYSNDLEIILKEIKVINQHNAVVVGLYNPEIQEDEIIVFIKTKGSDHKNLTKISEEISGHLINRTGLLINKIIGIKKIPKTSSGKIQRYILREEYKKGKYFSTDQFLYSPSSNPVYDISEKDERVYPETVEKMIKLFNDQLSGKKIEQNSNFFRLGGGSLQAIALLSQIEKEFQKSIDLSTFFQNPTPECMLKILNETEKTETNSLRTGNIKKPVSYTSLPTQSRIYFLSKFKKDCIGYNIPIVLEVKGRISKSRLEDVIEQLIKRHESLRFSFSLIDGKVIAIPNKKIVFNILCKNVKKENIVAEIQQSIKSFHLDIPPLFRVSLFSCSQVHHFLIFDFHHLILDGSSIGIFLYELFKLYNRERLDEIKYQFGDYLNWRLSEISRKKSENEKIFWKKKFQNRDIGKELPADYERPRIQSFDGTSLNFTLEDIHSSGLSALARTLDSTDFCVFLTIYILLLFRLTGDRSPVVGIPVLARPSSHFNKTLGMFVNIVPFYIRIGEKISLIDLFSMVKDEMAGYYQNSHYQFNDFLDKRLDMSRNPLFDTVLVYHNWINDVTLPEGLDIEYYPVESLSSKFDLSLNILPMENSHHISFEYSTKLFKKNTIEKFKQLFVTIMAEAIKNPDLKIETILKSVK